MPMLTSDLRSPDERRSDKLTILRRRAPPPRSAGRFFKIIADTATAIGAFDPTFDSDAETDGPASGSSIWRREFSRVRSVSSTSIGILVDDKRLPSLERKSRTDSDGRQIDRVLSRKESEDSFVFEGFVRDRATSFYGKENDVVEVVGEGISPVSEKTLREELEEDYDMFYHGKQNEPSPAKEKPVVLESEHEPVPETATVSPEPLTTTKEKRISARRSDATDKAAPATEQHTVDVEEGLQSESLRTLKQFRLNDDQDRFTVSIVSEENSDEDLDAVSSSAPKHCGSIPLFVEEIGRVPRAVIIDGKVTRVRVQPENSSFRQAMSRARRSSIRWRFGKEGWLRRRKSCDDGGGRRIRWWNMKRFLFRHGSEADARDPL